MPKINQSVSNRAEIGAQIYLTPKPFSPPPHYTTPLRDKQKASGYFNWCTSRSSAFTSSPLPDLHQFPIQRDEQWQLVFSLVLSYDPPGLLRGFGQHYPPTSIFCPSSLPHQTFPPNFLKDKSPLPFDFFISFFLFNPSYLVKRCEGSEMLRSLQANNLACYSFLDASRRPESELPWWCNG